MNSFSLSNKKNMMSCLVILLVVGLILWLTFKPSTPKQSCPKKSEMIIPIGNGQSVALSREQYKKLMESYGSSNNSSGSKRREGFYVSGSDYIPNVQTENEYSPMLSLYKPKEQTRVIPEPTPTPGPIMPVPIPGMNGGSMMTGATGPVEGYGNIFLDNFEAPSVDPALDKYRQELTGLSPFFLNNGRIMNGEAV